MDRRAFLRRVAGAGLAWTLTPAMGRGNDLIRRENAKEGTTDWLLTRPRMDSSRIRCPWIEGFCSRTSVRAGQTLEIYVSTRPAAPYTLEIFRLGYYGGRGGRRMAQFGPREGKPQPDPPVGEVRVRECRWEDPLVLTIPDDWPSGVYVGKLTEQQEGTQSYVIFIVRDDRPCDFLFQCSDTTWAAYNRWPDLWSLYDDGTPPHNWYTGPGVAVSFDRPYGRYRQIFDAPLSQGSGEFLLWEFPLAYWMEQHGYDVSYISNIDTHLDGPGLLRGKVFLSVGHDEYWSLAMYEHVRSAIAAGVSAAFFSGNAVDGVIDIRPSSAGVPGRIIERIGKFGGPLTPSDQRHGERWKQHGPDPALLMGARSTYPYNGTADWTCVHEQHWLFEGTGMRNGEAIRGLVGWEHHGPPLPPIEGLEVVARGPVFSQGRPQGVEFTATLYPGPKGNWVFNAATIWWSDGLSEPPGYLRPSAHGGTPPGPDRRVQRITQNFFARCLAAKKG